MIRSVHYLSSFLPHPDTEVLSAKLSNLAHPIDRNNSSVPKLKTLKDFDPDNIDESLPSLFKSAEDKKAEKETERAERDARIQQRQDQMDKREEKRLELEAKKKALAAQNDNDNNNGGAPKLPGPVTASCSNCFNLLARNVEI